MITAKLVGSVWATKKADSLNGFKLMLAEQISGHNEGCQFVVVDEVGAGIGDRVIITFGSSARRMVGNDLVPIDAAVIGIIDEDCNLD